MKNTYSGKRCFIIGNGPSLKISDLDRLTNEFSFGTNRIYQLFSKTQWRPTFYLSTDTDVIRKGLKDINSLDLPKMFFNFKSKKLINNPSTNLCYINIYGPFKINRHGTYQKKVSEQLENYFSKTENVTCSCIEFAFYLGFSEIYLLGVDNSYNKKAYADGIHGFVKPDFNPEAIEFTYATLRNYAEKYNIKLINATRGGELNYLERVNFDSII